VPDGGLARPSGAAHYGSFWTAHYMRIASEGDTLIAKTLWTFDASHTGIRFMARHMVVSKARGAFKTFRGSIELDEDDFANSAARVTIDAASVDTREPLRDSFLRSADFFDVEKFPSLVFESTRMVKKGKQDYDVRGNLTIRGVTREVLVYARFEGRDMDPWGNQTVSFSATATVNREDFGLKFSPVLEAGGVLVSPKIEIELDVQATRSEAA
jgi:polyisoprenoid-binding protein YceI